jgi:hypothetical protein
LFTSELPDPHTMLHTASTSTPPRNQSFLPEDKPILSVLLHGTAKTLVSYQSEVQEERASTDVVAFCALLARIMMRCLKEQNEQALRVLSLSWHQSNKEKE